MKTGRREKKSRISIGAEKIPQQGSRMLDSKDRISSVDGSGLIRLVGGFPEQMIRACGLEIPLLTKQPSSVQGVGVAGVCSTRVCAIVLRSLMDRAGRVPVFSFNGFSLPGWVTKEIPLIFISFSGNTMAVLSCFEQALERKIPCLAVTTGGSLKRKAQERAVPVIEIPKEQPPNRTVLPYMLVPLLLTCIRTGLLSLGESEIQSSAQMLTSRRTEWGPDTILKENLAKQIASICFDKQPLIYTEDPALEGVVLRWRNDFNENAKVLACTSQLPEMSHNEIVGLQGNGSPDSKAPLFLSTRKKDSPAFERLDITIRTLEEFGYRPAEIPVEGGTDLERILYGILLGDHVSVYLAVLKGVDPHAVDLIDSIRVEDKSF